MKKLLISLIMLFCVCNICFAQEDAKTPINFIYIHGSDQGTVEEFDIWINRMHPNMKKNLEASAFIQKHLLSNAYIKPEQEMLYWADKTKKDKSLVEVGLTISKLVSSCFAQLTRTTLAHLLHDAIWLQKYVNMQPILDELNEKVIANAKKGEKNVLVGYSAGTFITYQYLMFKLRDFELTDFFQRFQKELEITSEDLKALKAVNPKPTCIDAVVDSNIAIMSADNKLIPISNKEKLRANFKKLNAQTELSCAPDNAISGVINFGSPIVIFYSNNDDDEKSSSYYFFSRLCRHLIENGEFVLTVNYKTDPLGVPTENIKISEAEGIELFNNLKLNGGFIYDTVANGGIMFISSHLKYWDQTNHFTKAVAKAYEDGYNYFYEINTSKK